MAAPRCVFCNQVLPAVDLLASGGHVQCRGCHKGGVVLALPALLNDGRGPPPPGDPPAEGEATCFYSPQRKATKECKHCGVLISDAWAASWGADVVCIKCLEHLRDKSQDANFQAQRTLWDNVTLALALTPLTFFLWPLATITAPSAIFLGLWHWNSPRSLLRPSRVRLVAAILLAGVQVALGVFLIAGAWFGLFR